MPEIEYHEVMSAEQHPDCYDGPNCDQMRPDWHAWAEGDKCSPDSIGDEIKLAANSFPPGTKVSVSIPLCPECGDPADLPFMMKQSKCDCGFDWDQWARDQYT